MDKKPKKQERIRILPWNRVPEYKKIGIIECESKIDPMCLKRFISSGERICARCRHQ